MVWMNCFALIAANDVGASVSTTVSPWNNSSDCRISTIEYVSTNSTEKHGFEECKSILTNTTYNLQKMTVL